MKKINTPEREKCSHHFAWSGDMPLTGELKCTMCNLSKSDAIAVAIRFKYPPFDSNKIGSYLKRVCINCGFTFGSHLASYSNKGHPKGTCPGHEGKSNWDKGQGTLFKSSGRVKC